MGYQEVGGMHKYRPYEKMSLGETVAEGTYIGTNPGQYGVNYLVQEPSGEIIEVNGCGVLKHRITTKNLVQEGDWVKIVYNGKDKMEKGKFKGKDVHDVKLYVDPERSLNKRPSMPSTATQEVGEVAKAVAVSEQLEELDL